MKKDPSKPLLLDINVLVALAWPNHQFHAAATRRLETAGQQWATCALTQLGFIRLSSNPAAVQPAVSPAEAAALLAAMTQDRWHTYLGESWPPSKEASAFSHIRGHQQVSDVYLLALARRHRARLVTFDSRLSALGDVEVVS